MICSDERFMMHASREVDDVIHFPIDYTEYVKGWKSFLAELWGDDRVGKSLEDFFMVSIVVRMTLLMGKCV